VAIPPDWRENVFELNARKVYKRLPAKMEPANLPALPE
jgi:hypothetical protein